MGFFDKVKEAAGSAAAAVSEGAKNASSKVNDFTEKSKLNKEIKAEETKINNFYIEMGKKIFEENAQAPAGFEEQFAGIKAAQEKISSLNEQLIAVDGFINCEKCGAKIKPDQPFCQCCGAKVEVPAASAAPAAVNTVSCPSCGKVVPAGQPFCDGCGTKLESAAAPAAEAPVENNSAE